MIVTSSNDKGGSRGRLHGVRGVCRGTLKFIKFMTNAVCIEQQNMIHYHIFNKHSACFVLATVLSCLKIFNIP